MKVNYFILLLINTQIVWLNGEQSSLISRCRSYNRFDLDIGIVLSCDESLNATKTGTETETLEMKKNQLIYFGDSDSVECVHRDRLTRQYYNKHMIDAIRFENCHLNHIPYDTFKSYPFLRVLDISNLSINSLQPEHFIGAKRPWELFAPNNNLNEIPPFLFMHAGSVIKVDLSYNHFQHIDARTFVRSTNITMLDLSGNRIEVLNERTFNGLVNLTHMSLADNKISEIDAFAFDGLRKLFLLDLSNNRVTILKNGTFANLTKLNHLQLSFNRINQIEPLAFATAHSLLRLDLSHNNITDEQLFDNLYNLQHLDLSHNPINELGIGTFAKLDKLEYLDLKHTNLTTIELGTFSHQRGMVSLDLSENNLKSLDFGLFLPAFRYLESIYLDGNHLSELDGFSNSLFPRLNSLGITNNNFNCSYLKRFMRSVDWEQIRLPVDRMPLNIHQTNIRGVACDLTDRNTFGEEKPTVQEFSDAQSNAEVNEAVEMLIKHLPATNDDEKSSDVKVIKLQSTNGSNVMILVW